MDNIPNQLSSQPLNVKPSPDEEAGPHIHADQTYSHQNATASAIRRLDRGWSAAFRTVSEVGVEDSASQVPATASASASALESSMSVNHVPKSTVACLLEHLAAALLQNYEFSLRFQQTLHYHDALLLFASGKWPRGAPKKHSGGQDSDQSHRRREKTPSLSDHAAVDMFTRQVAAFLGEGADQLYLKHKEPQMPSFPCTALNAAALQNAAEALQQRQAALAEAEHEARQRRAAEDAERRRRLKEEAERKQRRSSAPVGTQTAMSLRADEAACIVKVANTRTSACQTQHPVTDPALQVRLQRLFRVVNGSVDSVARGVRYATDFARSQNSALEKSVGIAAQPTGALFAPKQSLRSFENALEVAATVFDAASSLLAARSTQFDENSSNNLQSNTQSEAPGSANLTSHATSDTAPTTTSTSDSTTIVSTTTTATTSTSTSTSTASPSTSRTQRDFTYSFIDVASETEPFVVAATQSGGSDATPVSWNDSGTVTEDSLEIEVSDVLHHNGGTASAQRGHNVRSQSNELTRSQSETESTSPSKNESSLCTEAAGESTPPQTLRVRCGCWLFA